MRSRWKALSASGLVGAAILALASASCGSSTGTSSSSQALAGSGGSQGSDCILAPIDNKGDLPACAAGTTSASGPGLPYNFVGRWVGAITLNAEQVAARSAADALSAARNPPGQDPIDRGFPPTTTSAPSGVKTADLGSVQP